MYPTVKFNTRITILGLLLACTVYLSGCAVNPVTGKTEIAFVSESEEVDIGTQQYLPSQQSQGGLYQVDKALSAYVNEVGQRLARVSDRNLPYEFVVLNNGVPNAWALPGGKIAVNRGLLLQLNNEAELAAVLGHEIVHAAARHGAKSMERGTLLQGAILVTAVGAAQTNYGNYIVGGAQIGAQLLSQTYGRNAELESDYYGIQYMSTAGYDPAAAISLQQTFVNLAAEHESSWLEGLFASHPPSEERVAKNRQTVKALTTTRRHDLELGEARYQNKLNYLKSKNDAYNAFDKANDLASSNKLDSALASINQAITNEPKEARFYGLKADIYLEKKQYKEANSYYDKAIQLDSDYFEYYLGRGLSMSKLGQAESAKHDLQRSNELLPTAIAMNELGELSLHAGDTRAAKGYFHSAMGGSGEPAKQAGLAFAKLDLPENPAQYFSTRAGLSDGQLVALVSNQSGMLIKQVELTFSIRVNGEQRQRTVTLGPIEPGQQLQVASGYQFTAVDHIESLSAVVTRASL